MVDQYVAAWWMVDIRTYGGSVRGRMVDGGYQDVWWISTWPHGGWWISGRMVDQYVAAWWMVDIRTANSKQNTRSQRRNLRLNSRSPQRSRSVHARGILGSSCSPVLAVIALDMNHGSENLLYVSSSTCYNGDILPPPAITGIFFLHLL
ncbi:hypothetical protein NHX12_022448 [Muraenolepis orangiensis]|uniref:Uncharacterized protein n=1 Tax=Muraenolepis orangiensis TaxID=630683 RepID=A0A9Q0ENM2_9TELE|nr:hypothetical protein NHX12_022448 [Muraenolepis orangiensis]